MNLTSLKCKKILYLLQYLYFLFSTITSIQNCSSLENIQYIEYFLRKNYFKNYSLSSFLKFANY